MATIPMPSERWPSHLISRAYAALLRAAIPTLDSRELHEASEVFRQVRQDARRRSFTALTLAWFRELRALAMTAHSERRANRRGDEQQWPTSGPSSLTPGPQRGATPDRRPAMGWLLTDLRQGVRHLVRTPVMTLIAAGSVALALTGVIVVFALANSILWRPMAVVSHPEQLVRMFHGEESGVWSYPHYALATEQRRTLQSAAAYSDSPVVVATREGLPRTLMGVAVSANIFDVLGVSPLFGRPLTDDDGEDVALIGHGFWTRELGGRTDVLGESLTIGGRAATIVGVLPAGLPAISTPIEAAVWFPISREARSQPGVSFLSVIGRMAPGATVEDVRAEMDIVAKSRPEDRLFSGRPEEPAPSGDATPAVRPISVFGEVDARVPPSDRMAIMAGLGGILLLVGLILAVACANVGNMTLARVSARRTEIAVRLAIGAGRKHIVSLIVAESVALAAVAGVMALLLTVGLFRWMEVQALMLDLPPGIQIAVDGTVVTFASLVALTTTLVFGLVPAFQAARTNVQANLQSGQPTNTGGQNRIRRFFVAAQVAGSATFAVLAILFMRSVAAVHDVDLGYDPTPVAVVSVDGGRQTNAADLLLRLRERLGDSLAHEPGIEGFAFATSVPMSGFNMRVGVASVEGYTANGDQTLLFSANRVSPNYFRVVGIPLLMGREFTDRDSRGAPPVAIINQAFADRYWPGESALGKRIGDSEVVGVVADVKLQSLRDGSSPFLFQPLDQADMHRFVVHARSAQDPAALAQRLQRMMTTMESSLSMTPQTMEDAMSNAYTLPRVMSWAFAGAGLLSTLLATVGLYGVMSYLVGLRRREFGVRTALGATPSAITSMVIREGVRLVGVGLAVGLLLAVGIATVLQSELVGVAPLDPLAIMTSSALLVTAAAAASLVPALRAARVDPIGALRN